MNKRDRKPVRVFGCFLQILTLPISFVAGYLTGLFASLGAVAGMLLGVRLLTGKIPFLVPSATGEAGRQLSLRLLSSDDARRFFAEQREKMGGEIKRMKDEIQAVVQGTKSGDEASP